MPGQIGVFFFFSGVFCRVQKYPTFFWGILSGTKIPHFFSGVFCREQKYPSFFWGILSGTKIPHIFSGVFCRVQKYPTFLLGYFVGYKNTPLMEEEGGEVLLGIK